jgi:hypothetical protein
MLFSLVECKLHLRLFSGVHIICKKWNIYHLVFASFSFFLLFVRWHHTQCSGKTLSQLNGMRKTEDVWRKRYEGEERGWVGEGEKEIFQFPQKLVKTFAKSDVLKLRVESEFDKLKIGLLIALSDPHCSVKYQQLCRPTVLSVCLSDHTVEVQGTT